MRFIRYIKALIIRAKLVNPWVVFASDLAFAVVSTFLSLMFVTYVNGITFEAGFIWNITGLSVLFGAFSILTCKTYRGVIRHSTIVETGRIVLTSLLKSALLFITVIVVEREFSIHILIFAAVIDLLLTFFIYTLFRVSLIVFYHMVSSSQGIHQENMLIYTGGRRYISLTGALFSKLGAYSIIGYVRIGENGVMRSGIYPEYSVRDFDDLSRLVAARKVNCLLFVDKLDVDDEQERLVRYCERLKLRMLLLPSVDEIIDGKRTYRHLPEVRIEDLLGRDEIKINMDEISSALKDKVVMVTGAAGSIGSELCRQLCTFGLKELVLFDSAETPMHNIRLELQDKFPQVNFIPMIGDDWSLPLIAIIRK